MFFFFFGSSSIFLLILTLLFILLTPKPEVLKFLPVENSSIPSQGGKCPGVPDRRGQQNDPSCLGCPPPPLQELLSSSCDFF